MHNNQLPEAKKEPSPLCCEMKERFSNGTLAFQVKDFNRTWKVRVPPVTLSTSDNLN
jgi:hypothetical protein